LIILYANNAFNIMWMNLNCFGLTKRGFCSAEERWFGDKQISMSGRRFDHISEYLEHQASDIRNGPGRAPRYHAQFPRGNDFHDGSSLAMVVGISFTGRTGKEQRI
jgi:hypothetical protein